MPGQKRLRILAFGKPGFWAFQDVTQRLLKNGNVVLLCAAELPDEFARRVKGGMPGSEVSGKMWGDSLLEATKDGRTVWEWRTWDHLDPPEYPIPFVQNERSEWTHGNSVSELADGNLLVSFRNISTVVKIDRKSSRVVWKLGAPPLAGQHAPVELPNGNILIFDNGPPWLSLAPAVVNPAAMSAQTR